LSLLSSRILRRYRRWSLGFPAASLFRVAPPDVVASYPAHRTFGFCRRPIFELPRISHPFSASSGFKAPGFPATLFRSLRLSMHLRVAPVSAPSGLAGDRSSSYPESRILQHLWRVSCEFPRNFALPSGACRCSFRVAPVPASSGCAGDGSSSYPESLVLRRLRALVPGRPATTLLRLRLPMTLRVSPRASSSGLAWGLSFRVTPDPRSFGTG